MLVTIITVTYNSDKTLSRTIESVFNQTYDNIEYIVVDGGSKDGTIEVARSWKQKFSETPGKTLTIISEADKGMYDALNKGACIAHGQLVGQINSDDWYEPDGVETMVKFYNETHYDVAWGSIRIKKPSGDMIKHAHIGKLWTTSGWCHPGMFSRKEILLAFPYPLESMYDDFDYITAVYRAGKKVLTIDKIVSNFSTGGMSMQKSKGLKEVFRRTNISYRIYRKYGMSRLYYVHKLMVEMAKYLLG